MNRSAAEYTARAELHRPTDATLLGREIRRLHANGLTPRDISMSFRMTLAAVLEALAHRGAELPIHDDDGVIVAPAKVRKSRKL